MGEGSPSEAVQDSAGGLGNVERNEFDRDGRWWGSGFAFLDRVSKLWGKSLFIPGICQMISQIKYFQVDRLLSTERMAGKDQFFGIFDSTTFLLGISKHIVISSMPSSQCKFTPVSRYLIAHRIGPHLEIPKRPDLEGDLPPFRKIDLIETISIAAFSSSNSAANSSFHSKHTCAIDLASKTLPAIF